MSPDARAESLNERIRVAAAREGIPPIRLRNRIAFQRVLARLSAAEGWVLKGGFGLEIRLGLGARATKDLDLLLRRAAVGSALDVQDALDEALDADLGDDFAFAVRLPKPVRAEEAEPSTWRVVLDVRYAGALFGATTIDVVVASGRTGDDVEALQVHADLVGEPFTVPAIDVHRHAAEKFHAYARLYAHDRPSSRVKDLVDIVLLAGSGLLDPSRLRSALRTVFLERRTPLPGVLPGPPADWAGPFAALAAETLAGTTDLGSGWRIAADLYHQSTSRKGGPS